MPSELNVNQATIDDALLDWIKVDEAIYSSNAYHLSWMKRDREIVQDFSLLTYLEI